MISHHHVLERELRWLEDCLAQRVQLHQSGKDQEYLSLQPPPLQEAQDSNYVQFVLKHKLSAEERLVLILSLVPILKPRIFHDIVFNSKLYRVSGLVKTRSETALLPSPETALFILADANLTLRLQFQAMFGVQHLFYKQSVLQLGHTGFGEPELNAKMALSQNYQDLFVMNQAGSPRFSEDFPAQLLTTNMDWDDLYLMPHVRQKLDEVKLDLAERANMVNAWSMGKHHKAGCRILFFGEPGTGKTLAATLLGKYLNRDVYCVDISMVTSKYVGETTKRLGALFNAAEHKDWILLFDEGDALLGQRKNAGQNDNSSQYANQEVAFLLQRIEQFNGIVIVTTNLKNNIDLAFTRRFNHQVRFAGFDKETQHRFWQEQLPDEVKFPADLRLEHVVQRYSLSPASIVNVAYRVCLQAWKEKNHQISSEYFLRCIQDEELKFKGRPSF